MVWSSCRYFAVPRSKNNREAWCSGLEGPRGGRSSRGCDGWYGGGGWYGDAGGCGRNQGGEGEVVEDLKKRWMSQGEGGVGGLVSAIW